MNRIEREKIVIEKMIEIYCRRQHGADGLCKDCGNLKEYSFKRIEFCPKGDKKSSCRKCEIHCYSPDKREGIRKVMAYVGPRMLFIHPVMAIRHLISELR